MKHILETGIRLYHAFVVRQDNLVQTLELVCYDQYLLKHIPGDNDSKRHAISDGH